jgi:ribosomal protein L21
MLRFRLALAVALALPASVIVEASLGSSVAHADEDAITVGTELVATADVSLHKAEIVKGSRVSVTKLRMHEGRVDGVDVALADGHVVKVTMTTVRSYFRVAE